MDIQETRYAVIIGIDDYQNNPLSFCVNDAESIEETLLKNCLFKKENIFKIVSSEKNSEKDITGKYLNSLRTIKYKFKEKIDSIFFYFAGHGYCENNKSLICLQESSYPIEDIFEDISKLNPKIQMYMIDSCQSGSKVLTRGLDDKLNQYINSSEGAMFLYACNNTQSATEIPELKHGLLTNYILEAIENKDLYDDNGYLTFNRIVDFVQKKTVDNSEFNQIPVVENRISSYYPFAVDRSKQIIREGEHKEKENSNIKINLDDINRLKELRKQLQSGINNKIQKEMDSVPIKNDVYECINVKNFEELTLEGYQGVEDLEKEIVSYVLNKNLTPLKNLIYKETKKKNYNNPFTGSLLKTLDIINNVPSEIVSYIINFYNEKLDSRFNIYISNNINEVSFGLGYISYQAKWGLVILKIIFMIDWDGECNNQISEININHRAILLEENSLTLLDKINISIIETINKKLMDWNSYREEELDNYRTEI